MNIQCLLDRPADYPLKDVLRCLRALERAGAQGEVLRRLTAVYLQDMVFDDTGARVLARGREET